ncbi:MAG: transposase [Verrucomicrobiae bacterium]|nr:transposase [Verrucomicrobiae bacterium]
MPTKRSDSDSPWKDTLEHFLRFFLALCFPQIEAAIDWSRGFVFMDKELQAIAPNTRSTRLYVDKLVKLWRKDGHPQWVFLHLEVQSQFLARLAERVFRYHCRLSEAYGEPVVSLVVLADPHPKWRPQTYQFDLWGCQVHFQFPVCKLLDLSETMLEEASETNPVALLILAHRAAQRTRRDPPGRRVRKWTLIRQLYERGWEKKDVLEMYRLMDWMLRLPAEEERVLQEQVLDLEKEKRMPYISSAERFGIKKGLKEGRQEGLLTGAREAVLDVLEARFGEVPLEIQEVISGQVTLSTLRRWHRQAVTLTTLDAFRHMLENRPPLPR